MRKTTPLIERIMKRVVVDADGCWIYTGPTDKDGYGTHGGVKPHRVTYQDLFGPTDLGLDHLCRVRVCCNPLHLEPVPQRINVLRGEHERVRVARTDVCPKGHAMTPDNVKVESKGRRCRTCLLAWRREKYRTRRDAGLSAALARV